MKDTEKGLKSLTMAFTLGTVSMLGLFFLGFEHHMKEDLIEVSSLVTSFAGLGIILIFFFILYLTLGSNKLRKDADDHGIEHVDNIDKSSWFMSGGIISLLVFIVMLFLFASKPALGTTPSPDLVRETRNILLILQISSMMSTVLISLTAVFLVIQITSEKIKRFLWVSAGANIVSSFVGFFIFLYLFLEDELVVTAPRLETSHYLTQGLSFVGYSMFAVLLLKIYLDHRRMNREKDEKDLEEIEIFEEVFEDEN